MNSITLHKKILITLFLLLWGSIGWTQEPWCMVYDDLTLSERTALGITNQTFQSYQINSLGTYIDTSQLPAGLYRAVLVCDNNVMESNNLIIQ